MAMGMVDSLQMCIQAYLILFVLTLYKPVMSKVVTKLLPFNCQ